MVDCLRERLLVVDEFLPEDQALSMREDIDAHFADPQNSRPDKHFIWNYWHVPGSYNYLKAMPETVIARGTVEGFVQALRSWASLNFGLGYVTWPFLSIYVPGCSQGVHNDSVNGRLGYVYSLTRDARKTIGGETVVFQDRDLFRSNLDRAAAGVGLYDLVEPRFNRLVLFDDRIPHAVQRVDGSMDPVEARFVLHGHISEAGIITEGGLSAQQVQPAIDQALAELRAAVDPTVKGPFVLQLDIAPTGEVQRVEPILDRLASAGGDDLDLLRAEIVERVQSVRFPPQEGVTMVNLPLVF